MFARRRPSTVAILRPRLAPFDGRSIGSSLMEPTGGSVLQTVFWWLVALAPAAIIWAAASGSHPRLRQMPRGTALWLPYQTLALGMDPCAERQDAGLTDTPSPTENPEPQLLS